jgi:ATPase subunit of ABC transporter with duplicated ATPase domains
MISLFLADVCTDIILFKNLKLTYYKGNYDTFKAVREEVRNHCIFFAVWW